MTSEQQHLLLLKGAISDLSEAEQATIRDLTERIREVITADVPLGCMALAVVGLEVHVHPEKYGIGG